MSSSSAPSPSRSNMTSIPTSTAPSSPPTLNSDFDDLQTNDNACENIPIHEEDSEKRLARLHFVLEKAAVYASILKRAMDERIAAQRQADSTKVPKLVKVRRTRRVGRGRKRARIESDDEESGDEGNSSTSKRKKLLDGQAQEAEETDIIFEQPALITGAKLKDYQLAGLQWMVSLDQNGISGILADEMGLGKTLQTIAFSAYLREKRIQHPFLVVCPLSVLHNWIEEFTKFAPGIPVCMYHGTPAERAELRRTVMAMPQPKLDETTDTSRRQADKPAESGKKKSKTKFKPKQDPTLRSGLQQKKLRRSSQFRKADEQSDKNDRSEVEDVTMEESHVEVGALEKDKEEPISTFPVVVTTYEMIMKDRIHLSQYDWGYVVVDEGHRLKNLDCKLMREIKKYSSRGRMILTGTPLHNNLAELWSLLNFVLPELFDDVDSFQQWFNLPTMETNLGSERSSNIIHSLHAILKPFLLRRLKVDVEANLPPKKEYVLYAPLTIKQRELYDSIVNGGLRAYLIEQGKDHDQEIVDTPRANKKTEKGSVRKLRSAKGTGRKTYAVDGDDDEYFDMLENGEVDEKGVIESKERLEAENLGRDYHLKATLKQVNNMKLQNTVMQLRKVCSHPFLFNWPVDPDTHQPILNEQLVDASGKMMVLDRLLTELFLRRHKVLLFSQFTTMLDIIEDWACEFKGWKICRIDGSTAPLDRRDQMNKFQTGGNSPDAPCLFLLSTRAGGLGINLVAADTVIFYDQDWNPQMDAQAQDRAHRIGQTKPVLIFRLVSAHTIETKIMQRATEKRKLEALVIAKGKFKMPASAAPRKPETMADMAASLLKLEGEKIEVVPNTAAGKAGVLSDEDLEMLLDRRPEVFADRGKGWTSAAAKDPETASGLKLGASKKAAFAVYEAPVDEGNEALAKMLGEDVE